MIDPTNERKPTAINPPEFVYDVDLDEFYESKMKSKTTGKRMSTGRWEVPEYVKNVHAEIQAVYPDTCPPLFIVDKIIKAFWRDIERQLVETSNVQIYGFGNFIITKKFSSKSKQDQYYIKFKLSRHFTARIREQLGTLTPAEERARDKQRAFMKQVWENRLKMKLTPDVYKPITEHMPKTEE